MSSIRVNSTITTILFVTFSLGCNGDEENGVEIPNGETEICEVDADCEEALGDLGPCQVPSCIDTECVVVDLDGEPCDDGDPCTEGVCDAGSCVSTPLDDCTTCTVDADCEPYDDGDPCTGTLSCIDCACLIDPESIPCGTSNDTDCRANTCDPSDGSCSMQSVNEGGSCEGDPAVTCESAWVCQEGECVCPCASNDDCAAGHLCIGGSCLLEQGTRCSEAPTVTDVDGNEYRTVEIGTQCWMAENMRAVHFADGTPIDHVVDAAAWEALEAGDMAYAYYNNDANGEAELFGALYTWGAAMNGEVSSDAVPSGIQGVCPDGWHLPSDEEWTMLVDHLIESGYNYDDSTTENKVAKSLAAAALWSFNPNEGVVGNELTENDRSGFSALPGGHRDGTGSFPHWGNHSRFWSSTEQNPNTSFTRILSFNRTALYEDNFNKRNGGYVRCVRD